MIKIYQDKFHNPPAVRGNCLAACVASLMETSIRSCPMFENATDGEWFDWLLQHAEITGHVIEVHKDPPDGFSMVGGKSPRGEFGHEVIFFKDQLFHDPHPSGAGIEGEPWEYITIKRVPKKQVNTEGPL